MSILMKHTNTVRRDFCIFIKKVKAGINFYQDYYKGIVLIEQKLHSQDISSNGVEQFCNDSNRRLLKAKTKGLIMMDREQYQASVDLAYAKAKAIKHLHEELRKKHVKPSAWFGGEYDERTYY